VGAQLFTCVWTDRHYEANSRLSQFCDNRLKNEFLRLVSFRVPCEKPVNLPDCSWSRHTTRERTACWTTKKDNSRSR